MADWSRRRWMQGAGLTALLSQAGCQRGCEDNLVTQNEDALFLLSFLILFVWGQPGSELLTRVYEKRHMRDNLASQAPGPGEEEEEQRHRTPASQLPSTIPSLTAATADVVAGRLTLPDGSVRQAAYLADSLGDRQVDGRIFAFEIDGGKTARMRGAVTLRPAVPGGGTPLEFRDTALSPDGRLLIVSQSGTPPQWIFVDTLNLTVAGRLMAPASVFPRVVAFAPDGRTAYAVASSQQFGATPPPPHSLHVIDTVARGITRSATLPANTEILDAVVSPDGGLLIGVANADAIHIVDLATLTYSARVAGVSPPGDTQPYSGTIQRVLMSPTGDRFYVSITRNPSNNSNARSAAVGVFDLPSATKVGELPLRYPAGVIGPRMGLSRDGILLVAGFQRGTEVQIFDTSTDREIDAITYPASFGFAALAAS